MKIHAKKITMKCVEKRVRGGFYVSYGRAVVAATPSWMVVRVMLDLFQHRYYRLGKILMCLIGQWPYQSTYIRRGILAVLILPTTYSVVALVLPVVKWWEDRNILLESVLPVIFYAICATKYLAFMWNQQKTLKLLNLTRTDWQLWARNRNVNILHTYAEQGRKITILYTVVIYGSTFVFMIQPMITKLINVVVKNHTEPGKFPFPLVFYHLDMQKYYSSLIMYSTVYALFISTALVASDTMLIIYVQHICSIFAAVGHELERIGSNSKSIGTGETAYPLGETEMVDLISCIDRHNDAIEYADLINATYAWNFFFTLGFGMILINISALQVFLRTNDLGATLTLIDNTLNIICYFYIESYISQILMDHSISIRLCIHNSHWYKLPLKSQKLLQLMILRCNTPCHLSVGNVLTMSLYTFVMMFRTFVSYLAFVRSIGLWT